MANKKSKSEKAVPSDNWERSPLEKVERNYNVINEGILTNSEILWVCTAPVRITEMWKP